MKRDLYLAMVTALAFSFSFPPFPGGFLAFWALVPFFFLLEGKPVTQALRAGYVTGILVTLGSVHRMRSVGFADIIVAAMYFPVFYALYALLHALLQKTYGPRAYIAIPFAWVGVEYLRSLVELGVPSLTLGYTQAYLLSTLPLPPVVNVYSGSLWVVTINVLIYRGLARVEKIKQVTAVVFVLILLFALPWVYTRISDRPPGDFQERVLYVDRGGGRSEEPSHPTNLMLLGTAVDSVIVQAMEGALLPRGSVARIRRVGSHPEEADWFIEQRLAEVLKGRGHPVAMATVADSTRLTDEEGTTFLVEYRVLRLGMVYEPQGRGRLNRRARVELFLRLSDEGRGRILWSGTGVQETTDPVPSNQIRRLEHPNLSFTQGVLPKAGWFKRLMEPALVLGITGAVTLLFFSFRSR